MFGLGVKETGGKMGAGPSQMFAYKIGLRNLARVDSHNLRTNFLTGGGRVQKW